MRLEERDNTRNDSSHDDAPRRRPHSCRLLKNLQSFRLPVGQEVECQKALGEWPCNSASREVEYLPQHICLGSRPKRRMSHPDFSVRLVRGIHAAAL
jgi:hypothetical protein